MTVTIIICLAVVSGFVAGWSLKGLSSKTLLGRVHQRWHDRVKKLSKERSSYLLQSNQLEMNCIDLEKKTKDRLSTVSFDQKRSLLEINRLREMVAGKDARIEQYELKIASMQNQRDTHIVTIEDLKTRYCAMSTEVERLRSFGAAYSNIIPIDRVATHK